jgi:hypothetical protein
MISGTFHGIQPFSGSDYMVGKCHITWSSSRRGSVSVFFSFFSFLPKNWENFNFHRVNLTNFVVVFFFFWGKIFVIECQEMWILHLCCT